MTVKLMLNGTITAILVPLSFHCPVVSVSDAALTIQGNGQTVVCLNLSIMILLGSARSPMMKTMSPVPITLTLIIPLREKIGNYDLTSIKGPPGPIIPLREKIRN